jgi:hypothetical protein
MTTNWNLTSDLVADRRAARESAAQRHRLLSTARMGHRLFHRRHSLAVTIESAAPVPTSAPTAHTTAPTTGPTPQRAAA